MYLIMTIKASETRNFLEISRLSKSESYRSCRLENRRIGEELKELQSIVRVVLNERLGEGGCRIRYVALEMSHLSKLNSSLCEHILTNKPIFQSLKYLNDKRQFLMDLVTCLFLFISQLPLVLWLVILQILINNVLINPGGSQ